MLVVSAAASAVAWLAPATSLAATLPQVNSLNPIGGPTAGGTSVVIKGARFSGATAVRFGASEAASFTLNSEKSITAVSPAGSGTVDVTVTTAAGTSATGAADQFTYGPNVTGVTPGRGPGAGGTAVTISGSDFTAATAVDFGSSSATSFTVNSDKSITAVSPAGSGTVDVTVSATDGTSPTGAADRFTYVPAPTVISVSPKSGPEAGGTEVTIDGTDFDEVTAVDFGMSPASFVVHSEGSITAFAPPGAGAVDITVTAFGGTSLTSFADQFDYVPPPSVTGVAPESGSAGGGTTVMITGSGLANATAVDFGSSSATDVVVNSDSSITASSPAGQPGETVDVTVATPGGTSSTSSADRFRYLQSSALLVKRVSPNTGAVSGGTLVTIGGSAFVGATSVDFGSVAATSFVVSSQHLIKAIAPAGTGTVDVTVTTPEGTSPTSSQDLFNYVVAPPTVEAVRPPEGREKGGTTVFIKGANFTNATAVHFGSAAAGQFTVNAKGTGITATAPPAQPTGKSTVDVTVTTPEGTSAITPADRFSYRLLAPIVTGLSPHKGPAAGGTTVDIFGEHFIEVSAVDFGSVAATSFTLNSDGSVTATSPAETAGRVNVTVTTPAGVSGPGECTTFGEEGSESGPCPPRERFSFVEPTVTDVSPNSGPISGGTAVTVTGTGFAVGTTATLFHFGKTALATSVDCTSITTCTMMTPAHARGTVDVKVTVAGAIEGSRSNPPGDQFSYG